MTLVLLFLANYQNREDSDTEWSRIDKDDLYSVH